MKTIILASAAVLGLGVTAAFAESEGGPASNTQFTEVPGFLAQAPVQQVPSALASAQSGSTAAFVTSQNGAVSVFAPNANEGANN